MRSVTKVEWVGKETLEKIIRQSLTEEEKFEQKPVDEEGSMENKCYSANQGTEQPKSAHIMLC